MAKGEKQFDSSKVQVKKFDNTPLPVQNWKGKLIGPTEVKKANTSKLPAVLSKIEVLKSASRKGGKNRTIPVRFHLTLTPGADGVAMIERGDGIAAFGKATGKTLKCGVIGATKVSDDGTETKVKVLDPNVVLKFVKNAEGKVFDFKSKNEAGTDASGKKDGSSWPKVDFFIEEGEGGGGEEEEDLDGEEEEEADEEEGEDEETDSDEEESDDEESDEEDEDAEDDEDSDDDDEEDEDEDEDESEDSEDEDEDEEDEDEEEEKPAKKKGKAAAKKPVKKAAKKK